MDASNNSDFLPPPPPPPPFISDSSPPPSDPTHAVKVAVHIRPLIGSEQYQGCKDCVSLVPGEPQVQIGSHSFTFDHVYGSSGSPSSAIFEECVSPLVEGLFYGYNATVLAYGQTGSGKTYTMGTGYTVGGNTQGIIPKVMQMIFEKVEGLKEKAEFQMRVSFIEILKEEVHDLLDPNPPISIKSELPNGFGSKSSAPGKPPIQIRENTNGGITLAGVTETDVCSLQEMAACLEQGSLCRATASTNMNSCSSRSHAIFTITVEQKHRWGLPSNAHSTSVEEASEDFLCAKLHLVDLAGSERAKKTGADGVRFKEGVHINKGLLALGNVISALGDDKKRKEGGHVPYRDSKLTRLLQDSLGGNSRTVMIACISPADSNAEETLNTLKYANRARNIQNKPVVNRDPMAAEMQRMRQQVELLQAELVCIRAGGSSEEIQILKEKTAWLEARLIDLRRELQLSRDSLRVGEQRTQEAQLERDKLQLKLDMLRNGKTWEELDESDESQGVSVLESYATRIKVLENRLQQLHNAGSRALLISRDQTALPSGIGSVLDTEMVNLDMPDAAEGDEAGELEEEEEAAKELEHARLQDSMDKELQELNKRLEQKEAEMKTFAKCEGVVLKQHFEKKIIELEEEKKAVQRERDALLAELTSLSHASDEQSQKMQESYLQKVKSLETQIADLKKKQENQAQLLKQKQRGDEAAKRLQDEIQRIKVQKVQLQNKIKQESEHFRTWKASREKEVLQLKKEGRRNEYEMHKLQALNQRQKMVLQRKTEEAAMATRRLKELLEARKPSPRENSVPGAPNANGTSGQAHEKALQQWCNHELEVAVHIHEVRNKYEKQADSRTALAKELAKLKHDQDIQKTDLESSKSSQNENALRSSMSPNAKQAKIALLESMLNASSNTLVAMASQLSEAEERERAFSGRARWQHLRSMADAKSLLQYVFHLAADARCQCWDKELENTELKEKISEITELLRQSEAHRKESDRQQFTRNDYLAKMLTSAVKAGSHDAMKACIEDITKHLVPLGDLGRPLIYSTSCLSTSCSEETARTEHGSFPYEQRKSTIKVELDASEASDRESDMDIDEDIDDADEDADEDDDDASDEDWTERWERRPIKIREKGRVRKSKDERCSNEMQERQSVGSVQIETVQDNESKLKSEAQVCCSCSRGSGCKTSKCDCRAAGNLCGSDCGCTVKKCANREAGAVEEEDAKEVAEAMETLRLDRVLKQAHRQTQAKECDDVTANVFVRDEELKHAEQVLVRHGASLLENVWNDELEKVDPDVKTDRMGDANRDHEIRNLRRPLSDIGNTKVSEGDGQPKMKQRKRWERALVQLVPVTAPHSTTRSDAPTTEGQPEIQRAENAIETAAAAACLPLEASSTGRTSGASSEAQGVVVHRDGPKMQRNARKKVSPPSSPLRARNVHAGGVSEEGGGANKRLANAGPSASPRGPGRGAVQEKENV